MTNGRDPSPEGRPEDEHLRGEETVLVAEDEALIRELVEAYLGQLGYRVLSAATGAEALEAAARHEGRIDLFVADQVLPDRSGLEVARALGAERPGLRVLLTSGHLEAGRPEREGVHFLSKPFTPRELAERVRALLDA